MSNNKPRFILNTITGVWEEAIYNTPEEMERIMKALDLAIEELKKKKRIVIRVDQDLRPKIKQ